MNYLLNDLLIAVYNHSVSGIKSGRSTFELQDIIEKRLNTLEIIKRFIKNYSAFDTTDEKIIVYINTKSQTLTKEEFNLLKEVLL